MMTIRFLLFLTLVLSPATALGQAYCSLREPVATMQAFFPDLDHYRSVVREITEADQSNILRTLPFTIHKSELATHTLYTVFSEDHALTGIVHVRTERGRWGLTEIAWLFDPELRIVGVRLQRSRDRNRSYIESEPFQASLRGKNFDEGAISEGERGRSWPER